MIFKCKICGGELNIQKGQSIVECEYCGVKQTLPRFLDENTKMMYDRANSYLLHNEFDKAENIYNQILLADKEDAEAYWNLVLCKYGVTYVKDPASGKYIPTCNRTHYASVFNDENYQNAIKYANAEKAELYEQDAKTIDDIQRGILSISKHEKPFDIFISYKETGENGARTKDSIKAQELYDKLTAEGYKVFFSRITLEDKIGTEYEPYIYAALASSKIMLVIGSSKDNLEAVWVKNEWSRYLSFAQRDSEKTLIPLYFDMGKADLPDEFAHLTAYDMTVDGFEQELIRGIKKLIPLPVMLAERRRKFRKRLKIAGVAVLILAVIGGIASVPWFMKLPDYNAAMQLYYDKNYPEATWAFADLGSYRDSKEMKDKCERSWRNSLATVITTNDMGRMTTGTYYINTNGELKNFQIDPGDLANDIAINEHGKVVSIAIGFPSMYILYEDGYVDNTMKNNACEDNSKWKNIVQISPRFNCTNIGLTTDGNIVYDNLEKGVFESFIGSSTDAWLAPIANWDNIKSFDYDLVRLSGSDLMYACLAGVRADGKLEMVIYSYPNVSQQLNFDKSVLSKFHDVSKVDVSLELRNQGVGISIAVLCKDGTIQTYREGVFTETKNNDDIVNVDVNDGYKKTECYYLTESGKYINLDTNITEYEDIVSIHEGFRNAFLVTRTGQIINTNSSGKDRTNDKAIVYDEWINNGGR